VERSELGRGKQPLQPRWIKRETFYPLSARRGGFFSWRGSHDDESTELNQEDTTQTEPGGFRDGAIAILPLWTGVVPFAIAFAVLARAAGASGLETQLLSLFLFAGAAQVLTVTLLKNGAGPVSIVVTVFLLNVRHVLYGLSYSRLARGMSGPPKALLAFLLTDEAYGITVRAFLDGRGSPAFLLGAGLSLYMAFNVATLIGVLLGSVIPDPSKSGLDFIFPLTFLALLVPLLTSWKQVLVVTVSGGIALGLSHVAPAGVTVLAAAVTGALLGLSLDLRAERA
jgi:4-azaleucine resistance transporter AzlC